MGIQFAVFEIKHLRLPFWKDFHPDPNGNLHLVIGHPKEGIPFIFKVKGP